MSVVLLLQKKETKVENVIILHIVAESQLQERKPARTAMK